MSKSLGDLTNNVKIKKRKREMVSDSDSDISRNTKKNKKKKLNGDDKQLTIKRERISDAQDHDLISKSKKGKKHERSTSRASEEETSESNVEEQNEFCKEPSSSRKKSIISPSAEYSRAISKILSDFENKNESLRKVCCEDSYINSLCSDSSIFIVQTPISLNPIELVGKEISFSKKKKIKTGNEKYISTSSHVVEPVVLTTNSQCIRLRPTCVVTLERDCKIEDSETLNFPNFTNNLGVNVIDPACLTRKNPIIGLEKEECERVLSSEVKSKLKAAERMYNKYKNKKIKKSSTQDGIKQENIKDEEIFKYLSQPSLVI